VSRISVIKYTKNQKVNNNYWIKKNGTKTSQIETLFNG